MDSKPTGHTLKSMAQVFLFAAAGGIGSYIYLNRAQVKAEVDDIKAEIGNFVRTLTTPPNVNPSP